MPSRSDGRSETRPRDRARSTVDRRTVLATGAALAGGLVAGCHSSEEHTSPELSVTIAPPRDGAERHLEAVQDGLDRAEADYEIEIESEVEEVRQEDAYGSVQEAIAHEGTSDLAVLIGEGHATPLEGVADDYPEQRWVLVPGIVQGAENVSGWLPERNQAAFLAGVAAGTLTREPIERGDAATDPGESIVGFVGADEADPIEPFERSYVEGVEWVDADVEVRVEYGTSFPVPNELTDAAAALYDDGADVVWHAAGAAGADVFEAAREAGRFALGSPFDGASPDGEDADVVLGAAAVDPAVATYEAAAALAEDDWGRVAGERYFDVENEGVDFAPWLDGFDGSVLDGLAERLEAARADLADGEIEPACGPRRCRGPISRS